jgi:hypothetical protein
VKVTIGLVLSHGFPVPVPFLTAWTRFTQYLLTGEGNAQAAVPITSTQVLESYGFPTDVARNELCRVFLDGLQPGDTPGDYLLFLDADMVMPPDIAHRLLAHQLPIVTGRYDHRKFPYHTVAMRKTGDGPRDYQSVSKLVAPPLRGLMPIDAAGAGSLLIRRDVLIAMREALGDRWFAYQEGPNGSRDISEDMWFFEQAKALGYPAWLDANVYSNHLTQVAVTPRYQESAYAQIRSEIEERGVSA